MISIDPITYVIFVPKADMTLVQTTPFEVRELDSNQFRLWLKDWEDNEAGVTYPDTHVHNTEVVIDGIVYARTLVILPPYTVTFEDGQYQVNITGSNNNIHSRRNLNQVSLVPGNSAGLISVTSSVDVNAFAEAVWANATAVQVIDKLTLALAILRNKIVTDPTTGTMTIYADDGVTPLLTAQMYENTTLTQPYRGHGMEVRDMLQ